MKVHGLLGTLVLACAACSDGMDPIPAEVASDTIANLPRIPSVSVPLRGQVVFAAFSGERRDLYIADAAGTTLRPLTADSVVDDCGVVSPDGMRIAFSRNGVHYTMRADRSDLRLTMEKPAGFRHVTCPAWSNDSRMLVYISRERQIKGSCWGSLHIVNADGTALRTIRDGPYFSSAEWSRDDGRLLLVSHECAGAPYGFKVHVTDADGREIMLLPAGYWGASWSPTGREFAYACPTQATAICIASSDGTSLRELTDPDARALEPRWSPDGSRIAYVSAADFSVYTINPDGTGKRSILTRERGGFPYVWSPDGKFLAFFCNGICTSRADGSDITRLTSLTEVGVPSWSPQ